MSGWHVPGPSIESCRRAAGQGEGEVTVSGDPLAVASGLPAVVDRSRHLEVTAHGWTWSPTGRNGFFAPFAYQADGSGGAVSGCASRTP